MKFHAESIITEAFLEEKNEKRIIVHVTQRQDLELSVFYDLTFKRDLCKGSDSALTGRARKDIDPAARLRSSLEKKNKKKNEANLTLML